MNTAGMIKKLQKQANNAELKALAAKHKLTAAQVKRDLNDALKDLRVQMAQEAKTIQDAIPRKAGRARKGSLLKRAPKKPVDVHALLAAAHRK